MQPPLRTAATAMVLATAGFLVPFMFVYGPELLLMGTWSDTALSFLSGVVGVTALAAAAMGYLHRDLAVWERVLLGFGSTALIFPGLVSDGFGLILVALVYFRPVHRTSVQA